MTTGIPKALRAYQIARRDGSRTAILEAAAELFLENGLQRTSVAQVAKEARVSPATIYKVFGTKEALFKAMMQREIDATQVPVDELVSTFSDARQAVRAIAFIYRDVMLNTRIPKIARLIYAEGAQNRDLFAPFFDAEGKGPTQTNGEALMRALQVRGLLRADRDTAFAVYQFTGMLNEVLIAHPQTTGDTISDLDSYIVDCVEMFCDRYAVE